MKVAFATNDRIHINAHFGWAPKIDMYEVTTDGYQFLQTILFDGDLKEDGNEDKLLPKVEALKDCAIVYVSAIGSSAASRLIKHHITPLRAQSETDEITDVLTNLIKMLNGSPPPWLRKVLLQHSPKTDDDFETDEPNLTDVEEEILV